MFALYVGLAVCFFLLAHPDNHVVNYSFFEQWSETEFEEVNFFIVAPHWYFRPHMGLLTVCAQHYEGLAWLGGFYALLCYTPHLYRMWNLQAGGDAVPLRHSPMQEALYVGFFSSMLYVGGTLPCGRFYYENVDGFFGNTFLRLSYEYLYLHLGCAAHVVDRLERWLLAQPSRVQWGVAAATQLAVEPDLLFEAQLPKVPEPLPPVQVEVEPAPALVEAGAVGAGDVGVEQGLAAAASVPVGGLGVVLDVVAVEEEEEGDTEGLVEALMLELLTEELALEEPAPDALPVEELPSPELPAGEAAFREEGADELLLAQLGDALLWVPAAGAVLAPTPGQEVRE